ncbi:unnamed protein product [Candidula unifasciata]|uniref:Tetratricopeptide repeat protein 29 n=1 Tax=Candidula unifasciata TaxID=100452 RepID=A0A8S3Z9L3_9EUPU|nr:unnamed protein product [Candidula unifasciata]
MATTLPPINKNKNQNNGRSRRSSEYAGFSQTSFKTEPDKLPIEKINDLRSELPLLKKHDIAKFRNSYNHNLCLDMLTDGFHMSFCELIMLIRQQVEERDAAGPESFLWTRPLIRDQASKLDTLKLLLTKAEQASRLENIEEEYRARFELAQSFRKDPNDQWLVEHFFGTCLEVAKKQGKETQMLAEGHCNVGLFLQNNKNHKEAVKHFEAYHKLAKNHRHWKRFDNMTFYKDSCVKLYHIYTIFGLELGRSNDDEDKTASLTMLTEALEMAKNSGDKKLEGEASYTLGLAYQKANKLDTAQSLLLNFYESCQGDSNSEGIGRACDAIAKIYARQGNKEKSVEFLKRFVELTEKTGLEKEYCLACHNLGNVCNSVGNYDEATEYFSKAYNISRALNDQESTNTNRVQYGIAMAHRMMGKFANHIVVGDSTCMVRLLDWKSVRTDEFNKQIPDTAPGAAYHTLLPPPVDPNMKRLEIIIDGVSEEEVDINFKDEGEELPSNVVSAE